MDSKPAAGHNVEDAAAQIGEQQQGDNSASEPTATSEGGTPSKEDGKASKQDGKTSKEGGKTPKSKPRSAAKRRLMHLTNRANKFPNGPEAKQLAEMEEPMPASLRVKIAESQDHAEWSEAFSWLASDLRGKARKGTTFYPKLVLERWLEGYPIVELGDDERHWLSGWVGYLNQFKIHLRSGGKYGPGVDLLHVLGAGEDVLGAIDRLDKQTLSTDPAADVAEPSVRSVTPKKPCEGRLIREDADTILEDGNAGDADGTAETNGIGKSAFALAQPVNSIGNLPPTRREMPFTFTELSASTAKTFWRAYWQSEDLNEILEKGTTLASDPWAKDEMQKLGPEAEAFFIQTMAKLGIPLS